MGVYILAAIAVLMAIAGGVWMFRRRPDPNVGNRRLCVSCWRTIVGGRAGVCAVCNGNVCTRCTDTGCIRCGRMTCIRHRIHVENGWICSNHGAIEAIRLRSATDLQWMAGIAAMVGIAIWLSTAWVMGGLNESYRIGMAEYWFLVIPVTLGSVSSLGVTWLLARR